MVGGGWFPVTKGGACLLGCSLTLPLACFPAPIPLTPFPAGRGDYYFISPGASPPAPLRLNPIGLRKPGKKRSLRVIPPPQGHLYGRGIQCRTRSNAGDARGEAPCIRKLKTPPSPEGKGVGGMGAEKQAKSRVGRRQGRHAPLRALAPQAQPMPLPAQPRGCKGRSPLHRKTKNSPFPGGEERSASAGRGDILPLRGRGAEKQAKGKVSPRGGELFQESPGASLPPPGATAVLPQKRRRRSASDRGSPTAHRSAQCGGKSWR